MYPKCQFSRCLAYGYEFRSTRRQPTCIPAYPAPVSAHETGHPAESCSATSSSPAARQRESSTSTGNTQTHTHTTEVLKPNTQRTTSHNGFLDLQSGLHISQLQMLLQRLGKITCDVTDVSIKSGRQWILMLLFYHGRSYILISFLFCVVTGVYVWEWEQSMLWL